MKRHLQNRNMLTGWYKGTYYKDGVGQPRNRNKQPLDIYLDRQQKLNAKKAR